MCIWSTFKRKPNGRGPMNKTKEKEKCFDIFCSSVVAWRSRTIPWAGFRGFERGSSVFYMCSSMPPSLTIATLSTRIASDICPGYLRRSARSSCCKYWLCGSRTGLATPRWPKRCKGPSDHCSEDSRCAGGQSGMDDSESW